MERGNEGGIAAYYNYSADGERNIKLTSPRLNIQQNATLFNNPPLVYPMLYASSLITLTKQGYTKHYFEEGRRICSKIGGGMQGNVMVQEIDNRVEELAYNYDDQYHNQHEGILRTFHECIEADPQIIEGVNLHHMLVEREVQRDEEEPAFFYHGDHLGSAAYLTCQGNVIQTLNYLPYGEDWVEYNFFHPNDTTRLGIYRFNGKEKDYESGFHYYGARYYWSEVLTGWLSVDLMLDKYPRNSPYEYCAWNPVRLIDPDGNDIVIAGLENSSITLITDLINICVDASSLGINWGGNYSLYGDDVLSATLDIVGILDPTGAADCVNAALQARNGEWLGAAVSGIGVIPYVGDAFKVFKIGKDVRIIKNSIAAVQRNRMIGKIAEMQVTQKLIKKFGRNAKVGEQVTAKFADGKKVVFNNVVVKDGKVVLVNETKSGNAALTSNQKRYFEDGESVTFVGGNAEKLGIKGLKINAATTVSTVERVPVTNL